MGICVYVTINTTASICKTRSQISKRFYNANTPISVFTTNNNASFRQDYWVPTSGNNQEHQIFGPKDSLTLEVLLLDTNC